MLVSLATCRIVWRCISTAVRGAEMGNEGKYIYRLGGNSCLSGDYMGLWSFDHELQIGERIVFEDMIHYTMVKTNMFKRNSSSCHCHLDKRGES